MQPPAAVVRREQDERPQDVSEAALCLAGCAGWCAGRPRCRGGGQAQPCLRGPVREARRELGNELVQNQE